MEWSAASATNAYLDTLKLCKRCNSWKKTPEPESKELISALAAGMKAKLIVEVTSGVSPSTIALAAAARQTGGRLVCILPEPILAESRKVIKDSGLKDMVEFKTGDPYKLLSNYENIDFTLVDCKTDGHDELLNMVDVNPRRAIVIANNLEIRDEQGGRLKSVGTTTINVKGKVQDVRSKKHPIGKGMEVTMIGQQIRHRRRSRSEGGDTIGGGSNGGGGGGGKSKWVTEVDEESGEEHIFRVPK